MALSFDINLGGNFVEALERSGKGLGDTEKSLTSTQKAAKAFDEALESTEGKLAALKADPSKFKKLADAQRELQKASKELGGEEDSLKEKLDKLGSIELAGFKLDVAEKALELFHELAEAAIDLGAEMVKAAGAAEDLNLAIKLDVGEEGLAKVSGIAESYGGTRFSAKTIKESLLPILEESGDEHSGQWDDLVTAATDVATRRNQGSAGARSALDALRSIEIQPQRLRGSLKELGIKQKDFYSDLGDLLGVSADSAEKQTKAGKIKAQTLLSVALHQIAEREGGELGNATNEGSKTLGSTLERIANLKEHLFEGLAESPGMKAVQGFLTNLADTLEGPLGTELVNKIGSAFESLFGDLSGPEGLEKMKAAIGSLATGVEHFIDAFTEAWPEIEKSLEAALPVAEKLLGVLGKTLEVLLAIPRLGGELGDHAAQNYVDNMSGAVAHQNAPGGGHNTLDEQDREEALARAGKGGFWHTHFTGDDTLNKEAWQQIDDEKGAWQPVSADEALNGHIGRVPQLAAGGVVSKATLAVIGEAGPEAVVPLSRLGESGLGGGMQVNVGDIIVHGGTGSDPKEIAREVRIELKKMLDEAVFNFGAAA